MKHFTCFQTLFLFQGLCSGLFRAIIHTCQTNMFKHKCCLDFRDRLHSQNSQTFWWLRSTFVVSADRLNIHCFLRSRSLNEFCLKEQYDLRQSHCCLLIFFSNMSSLNFESCVNHPFPFFFSHFFSRFFFHFWGPPAVIVVRMKLEERNNVKKKKKEEEWMKKDKNKKWVTRVL